MSNRDFLYIKDYNYLKWLIEYFCLSHKDLKKVIRMVEEITESYHDPSNFEGEV